MEILGQRFTSELVRRIQGEIERDPEISRRSLSRTVCEWIGWRSPSGALQDMSCRKALLELDRRGLIDLPPARSGFAFQEASSSRGSPDRSATVPEIECDLLALGALEVVPVSSRYAKASRIWNDLMELYHYLGSGPLCGAQIRYLVQSEVFGLLGALSFSAGTPRLKGRDEWIGWSEGARRANLQKVICNSRFLIAPSIHVDNLASRVLSLSLRRVPTDWQERYGYSPVLVETFVDPDRFRGTCYQAAGWELVGQSAGRTTPHPNGKSSNTKKDIYVHRLHPSWRKELCREPEVTVGSAPRPENPEDWAEEEFGSAQLFDDRLKARLLSLARDFFAQPGAPIPKACNGSTAKTKAAYRFFDNERVGMKTLIRSHVESTLERIKGHEVVLAVQDTTTLNYTAHPVTDGLGPINTTKDNGVGLILHETMAFSVDGTPLGLLDVQCWSRDPAEAGQSDKRRSLPIEEKESVKWLQSYRAVREIQSARPETMLVSVGDREADIYELFHEALEDPNGPKLLVRAARSRQRKVEDQLLWEKMAGESLSGTIQVHVRGAGSRKARNAKLEVRFAHVQLTPPQGKALKPVTVWAVYAREVDPPEDVTSPLEWMLLTTIPTNTFEDATVRLVWYSKRWGIEVYHRVLKSGCRIEDRRLEHADKLETCLAIDMVIAWRVYCLTQQGRETPAQSCEILLSEDEWKILWIQAKKEPPPGKPPALGVVVPMIAALGGFLAGKGRIPGTTTVWRGLQRLADMAQAYKSMNEVMTLPGGT
jgi:hypothetical protein